MISTKYANILTQIADKSMHALDVCGDMPDRINLTATIESIDTPPVATIIDEAGEFISQFDHELETGFFIENDVLRNGYAVRTVEHLLNKWWPIYYVAGKTHEAIESAEMGLTISKITGDHSVKLTELGAEVSTVLYYNRRSTLGLLVLFSGCISVTVKYVFRFSPHLITQHLDKLGLFIKDLPASTNHSATPASTDTNKNVAIGIERGFEQYICDELRTKLMPFLVAQHSQGKTKKPRHFGVMLYALYTLSLIPNPTTLNQEDLFLAIKQSFDIDWTKQALNKNINDLNAANDNQELKIGQYKARILEFLASH